MADKAKDEQKKAEEVVKTEEARRADEENVAVPHTNVKKEEVTKDELRDVDTVADDKGTVLSTPVAVVDDGKLGGVTEEKVPLLDKAVDGVSKMLGERPHVFEVVIVREDGKQYFIHCDQSSAAKNMRKEAAKTLRDAYENGKAVNYATIAERLRIDSTDVRALIDRDFVIGKPEVEDDGLVITD